MMADINIGPEAGGVPGGSGGAVRIPVLPTVSTPLRDAPPISRWRGAGIPETVPVQTQDIFEGIEKAGEKIGQILASQGQNQRSLQAHKLMSQFSGVDQAAQASAATNGSYIGADNNNMVSLYGQQVEAMRQQMLSDPDNQGVLADPVFGAQIRQRFDETQAHGIAAMTAQMLKTGLTEQEAQFKDQTKTGAVAAGGDYKITPDGTVGDGPNALQQRQDAQVLAHRIYGHMPEEEAAHMHAFDLEVASNRAQAISQDTSHPMLLDNFVKAQPPGTFTTEQVTHFHAMQRGAIEAPKQQAMAVQDAKSGATLLHLQQMLAAHDPNTNAVAYQANAAHIISDEQTAQIVGASYRPPPKPEEAETPTQPGLMAGYEKDFKENPFKWSAADIAAIPSDKITYEDRKTLSAHRHDAVEGVKKPLGIAIHTGAQQIRQSLTPAWGMRDATEAQKEAQENAVGEFISASPSFEKPEEANAFRDKVIKTYGGRPVAAPRVAPPVPSPALSKSVATMPPATKAALLREARSTPAPPAPTAAEGE